MDEQRRKCAAALIVLELLDENDRVWKRGKTRKWIKRREEKGYYNNIVQELSIEDTAEYKEMLRMCHHDLLKVLEFVEADITPHQVMGGHKVISAAERITLTLRFLATGETYKSLSYQFRISRAAISYIIEEVCDAIVKNMAPEFLKVPSSPEEWLTIAQKFEERWQFPNCIGAIDGKHVVMQPPREAGSHYYNYKHTHSIVLMAVAGPDYECIYADVGTNGRISDGGVWNKCGLSKAIENNSLSLPKPKCLLYGTKEVPHVFVGDDAFALKTYMMKPYPHQALEPDKRIYNYRHSRARRLSENLFGIMANRWRFFRNVLLLPPETIEKLVLAALTLHNFLRQSSSRSIYCPVGLQDSHSFDGDIVPGSWRQDATTQSMLPLEVPPRGHNSAMDAKLVRETFKEYFCHEGAVEWQWGRC